MKTATETDFLIVGAGPVGLFAAFELGLFGIASHLVDSLDRPGGQCAVYYSDKPIYDIPALLSVDGQQLVDRLMAQIAPFDPQFSFGSAVLGIERLGGGSFRITAESGALFEAKAVVIATGGGAFRQNALEAMEGKSPFLAMRQPDWGVQLQDELVPVDSGTFQTSSPGIFAIGDICSYPGKLRLILSGFHEAALMAQAVRRIVNPAGRTTLQYTTSSTELQKKLAVVEAGR